MLKTHEKRKIQTVAGTPRVNNIADVILQIETTGNKNGDGNFIYFVETVSAEEYNRTTAEGRAAEAKKELEEEIEANRIEMEEAQGKIEALEELLAEARDAREGMRNAAAAVREENQTLYKALVECCRIFGELPPEIETLIAKGEN